MKMKKILSLAIAVSALALPCANAQVPVTTVVVAAITDALEVDHRIAEAAQFVEQSTFWVQQAADMYSSIQYACQQAEALIRAEERALQNLKGVTKVESWDDFMDWSNRQLYLEQQAESRFNAISVKIGDKSYALTDIMEIPNAIWSTFGEDYWNAEFTEGQREEMWRNLGLSPANYAYVRTWQQKEREFMELYLTKRQIENEKYQKDMGILNQYNDKLAKETWDEPKMDDKELQMMIANTLIMQAKTLGDISMTLAEMQEWEAVRKAESATPPDAPPLPSGWDESTFEPLR